MTEPVDTVLILRNSVGRMFDDWCERIAAPPDRVDLRRAYMAGAVTGLLFGTQLTLTHFTGPANRRKHTGIRDGAMATLANFSELEEILGPLPSDGD